MAAANKILVVDLGASTLKFGEFGIGKGGAMTLLRFGVAEIGLDPNKEEERAKFVTPTLAKLLKDNGIKPGVEIILSISGQSVFMRFVKLPPVDPAQVEQVVTFEAQQNVPFPINEVTWDYQMMPNRGATAGAEAEAVIVAIKKELLEAEVDAVERAGVKVKRVDVAPFALLNAFRYSEIQTDDCALIVDIGARSTNLVFVEKSSFWIRNVPIAGNQISQSICNELQEPFTAAETLKKGKGFVSLGGVYADPDDADAARISKLIRSTMTKLHVDINRSMAYYRTSLLGAPPRRVFLTGGSSQLPYIDLFIADKLSLPVAFFNPLRNVSVSPSINQEFLQQNSAYTAEIVGLALRATGSCPAEITLDAPKLAAREDKNRKLPYYVGALAAWVLLFVLVGLYYWKQINLANDTKQLLLDSGRGMGSLAPEIGKLNKQQGSLEAKFKQVAQLGVQRDIWQRILSELNDKIPRGVWLTSIKPGFESGKGPGNQPGAALTEINVLYITGLYHSDSRTEVVEPERLRDFVTALADMPDFNIDAKNNIAETLLNYTTPNSDSSGSLAQKFTIKLKLKSPISLKL
jgi:type IV pilus assembly protein PilM